MRLPEKMKKGISAQLTYMIVVGIIVAGVLTYFFQYTFSRRRVIADTGIRAEESALELISTLREYPAYEWLLPYWYEHAFRLNPGDRVFVYTDGVPEAINQDNEQFGTDRMLEVLNRNRDAGTQALLALMKEEIDAFAGDVPQFDDTTMLSFR